MNKEIRIFDTSNNVIKVSGIYFELLDVSTGTVVGNDTSRDLNPPHDEWGVMLNFNASSTGPFEIYTNDPAYKYPGNMIESLEGANTNRIDIDLHAQPVNAIGGDPPKTPATVTEILNWIQAAPNYEEHEKRAARMLFLNYIKLIPNPSAKALPAVRKNWEEKMRKLGIPFENMR